LQIQRYNQEVYEAKSDVPIVETLIPYADFLYKFDRKKSIRAEVQYMHTGEEDGKKHDFGDWVFAQVEFSLAPHWSFVVADMYNSGPGKESPTDENGDLLKLHYPRFDVFYVNNSNRYSLSYIKQVEGVIVVSTVIFMMMFTSCDEREIVIPDFVPPESERVVVIEEMTGVSCQGCPNGSTKLHLLTLGHSHVYDSESRSMEIEITGFPEQNVPGTFNVTVQLLENHIIDAQKNGPDIEDDYEHMHVLRAVLTESAFGDNFDTDLEVGENISRTFTYTLPPFDGTWVEDNIEVVACSTCIFWQGIGNIITVQIRGSYLSN